MLHQKKTPAPLIDVETFFKNGEKSMFRISPDGNYFSYRADYKGISNIFVQKVSDSATEEHPKLFLERRQNSLCTRCRG